MKTDEIRSSFLNFFASKGHKIFPSDYLVPREDSTVLFTSAGMNQFKPYFIGARKDVKRAASCQKCLRTDDLEKVGKTSFHHTFFEMLGNFSFGDYFKEEAILWGWEFITEVMKLPQDKIWISVYKEDDEAYQIWKNQVGVLEKRIVKLGPNKNFWPADAIEKGPDGPCGPCSEIFYDLGEKVGCGKPECDPGCDCGRFVEIWNLVFTQFNRKKENGRGILEPLPSKNIDTGMGLERIASVMQGVETNFQIDIFVPLVEEILVLAGRGKNVEKFHVYAIADHIRAVSFAICDGVFPSNEERGYVVRKIIRKAIWHGYKIGLEDIFLYKLVPLVASCMRSAYPEVEKRRENISQIVKAEEEKFQNTLEVGLFKLNELIQNLRKSNKKIIPGEEVFYLYDTYGFPYELTQEIARENGLEIEEERFKSALDKQRHKSKAKSRLKNEIFSSDKKLFNEFPPTEFVGYDLLKVESEVLAIFDSNLESSLSQAKQGERVFLITAKTPFYGEAGGQIGDRGEVSGEGFFAQILDTQIRDGRFLHMTEIKKGFIVRGTKVLLSVDKGRRLDTARNHTATHILQAVLRKILGEHVEQSGSYVTPERLRFDFTHFKALTRDEIDSIEEMVNRHIMDDDEVRVKMLSYEKAREEGALAFFTEKYQEMVRVIEIGNYSKELCGGTHLKRTGQIGLFKIVSESSSASGIRRIEAVTGGEAWKRVKKQEELIDEISLHLKVEKGKILLRLKEVLETLQKQEQVIKEKLYRDLDDYAERLISKKISFRGINFITSAVEGNSEMLATLTDKVKEKSGQNTLVVLYSIKGEKLVLVIGLTPNLVQRGLDARVLVKKISGIIKGGGGGRADFVQAGGKGTAYIKEALDMIKKEVREILK